MTRSVLLADESQTIRALFRLSLAGQPLAPLTVGSAAEALQIVRTRPPDVALVDVMLADIDGYQLCRMIREQAPGTRVVLLAAHQVAHDEALAREVGASGLLRKPFERRALLAVVLPVESRSAPDGGAAPAATTAPGAPGRTPEAGAVGPTPPPPAASPTTVAAAPVATPGALDDAAWQRLVAALGRMLDERLPDLVRQTIERLLPDAVAAEIDRASTGTLRTMVEPVVWKIVPSLAEQMIKEEIERLTAEIDAESPGAGSSPEPR